MGGNMSEHQLDASEYVFAEADETMPEDAQVTVMDTGWSEEEKERMKTSGYDSLDMVRAWYS